MPGVDLNLDLPSGSDSMAVMVAKTAAALSAIEDDLAGKIVPAEINVNGALSMNGSYLTNAGALQLIGGNAPTAAGSLYYSAGEFYAIDSTGTIQLTAGGNLNAGALGSIVGDYGGSNPARVTYNDASGEYRFTEDVGVWADLVADDVVLEGTNGSVRLGVDPAITTARQMIIKSLPTTGVGFLVYNAATSTVEDGSSTAVTTLAVTNLSASTINVGALNVGSWTHSSFYSMGLDLGPAAWSWKNNGSGGSLTLTEGTDQLHATMSAGNSIRLPCPGVLPGDRINLVTVGYTSTSSGTPTVSVILDDGHPAVNSIATTASAVYTATTGSPLVKYRSYIANSLTAVGNALSASGTVGTGGKASIRIVAPGSVGVDTMTIYNVSVIYDRTAVPSATIT